ncbi:hypothetical protein [Mesorhizobium sp. B2-8-5]|nr:hypothetical protein [Mesorhizobium sp. B2-8-5]
MSSRRASRCGARPKALPTIWINPEVKDLFAFRFEDFRLADASIKAPIAV